MTLESYLNMCLELDAAGKIINVANVDALIRSKGFVPAPTGIASALHRLHRKEGLLVHNGKVTRRSAYVLAPKKPIAAAPAAESPPVENQRKGWGENLDPHTLDELILFLTGLSEATKLKRSAGEDKRGNPN